MNRLLQAGSAPAEEIKKLEDEVKCLKQDHENHREEAQKSHGFYVDTTARSKEWAEITSLEQKETLTEEEKAKLDELKSEFNLVVCADYQMCKLVPYWGMSAQPGSTQKLNHDVFGIVNHGSGSSTVYLFDSALDQKIPTTLYHTSPTSLVSYPVGYGVFTFFWTILQVPTRVFT